MKLTLIYSSKEITYTGQQFYLQKKNILKQKHWENISEISTVTFMLHVPTRCNQHQSVTS